LTVSSFLKLHEDLENKAQNEFFKLKKAYKQEASAENEKLVMLRMGEKFGHGLGSR
jgi:hypothetical protein